MRRRLSGSPVIFSSGAAMRNSPGWCRCAARPAQACVVTAEMPLSIPEAPTRARNGRSRNFEIFATIRESRCRPLFRQLPCRQIVSSRQISNVAEKANGDAARCSGSPKPISIQLEGGFVRMKGAPGMPQIARRACRRERSAFQGFTMARGRVARGPGALSSPQTGDRGFESISLQRRVCCEPDFRGAHPATDTRLKY